MVIGAIAYNMVIFSVNAFAIACALVITCFCIDGKLGAEYFAESNCFSCDHTCSRGRLYAGENREVDKTAHHADIAFGIFMSQGFQNLFLSSQYHPRGPKGSCGW